MSKYINAYPSAEDYVSEEIMEEIERVCGEVIFDRGNPKHREIFDSFRNHMESNVFVPRAQTYNDWMELSYIAEADFNNTATLVYLAMGSVFKNNGQPTPKALEAQKVLQKAVERGADIYRAKSIIAKRYRNHFSVYLMGGRSCIDEVALQAVKERKETVEYINELTRAKTLLDGMNSPYDSLFEKLEQIEQLKRERNRRELTGDYSQSICYAEKISRLKEMVEKEARVFDPYMLERVALSKKEVETENQKFEAGFKDDMARYGAFVVKGTTEHNAAVALQLLARSAQKKQEALEQKGQE